MKEAIKELAAMYNTWGYEHGFCRMAEKVLVNDNQSAIEQAKTLSAQARNVI